VTRDRKEWEMIDRNVLRGMIVMKGMSQSDMAEKLGMTPKTFYDKMKKGVFDSDEIYQMISLLGIDNPKDIFFCR
jgi:DNA-binding XRE family transcriptional regulator